MTKEKEVQELLIMIDELNGEENLIAKIVVCLLNCNENQLNRILGYAQCMNQNKYKQGEYNEFK